jgi:hypothetical protein
MVHRSNGLSGPVRPAATIVRRTPSGAPREAKPPRATSISPIKSAPVRLPFLRLKLWNCRSLKVHCRPPLPLLPDASPHSDPIQKLLSHCPLIIAPHVALYSTSAWSKSPNTPLPQLTPLRRRLVSITPPASEALGQVRVVTLSIFLYPRWGLVPHSAA